MKLFTPLLVTALLASNFVSAQQTDSLKPTFYPPKFHVKSLAIPASLMLAGVITNSNSPEAVKMEFREERQELIPGFHTKVDNYLQFSPFVIAYGLDAAGVKSKTNFADRAAIMIKGELLMLGSVTTLKSITHQLRPDGSTYNSFPSGHTAQAFAAATFLAEEYKHKLPWMPYAAYGIASGVGALRMANNRHYVSDVLFGAGLGILSMKLAYWTHQYRWGNHKQKELVTL